MIGGYGGIGRRAGFRFLCRKACGFDPHYPYHTGASIVSLAPVFRLWKNLRFERFLNRIRTAARKLFLSQNIKSQAHVLTFFMCAAARIANARR